MQRLARFASGSAVRNLWRRPMRTLVTMIGVGLAVGFLVALTAMTNGFTAAFTQLASAGQADLLAEQANASDATFSRIDDRIASRVRLHPEVRAVSRLVFGATSAPGLPFFLVFGLDPQEEYFAHFRLSEGRPIARPREIMLGRFAATSLEKSLGATVQVAGSRYTVVGIYESGTAYEDGGGVITIKDAQQRFGMRRQSSFLGIRVRDPARAVDVARDLEAAFPQIIVSQASAVTERMQDFATMRAIFNALVGLTIVVGSIVMLNVMLMSVFERTQEIGVLRAVGWRRRRVVRMVLGESIALSLLSAMLGMAIGVGLNALFVLTPAYGQFLTPQYSPGLFVQVGALALVLGALGGLYPAWRAAGLRPVEALRYE
jgi:ABC-type antimicrobial peptide transport system permease subunit